MANVDSAFTGIINNVSEKAAPHLTAEQLESIHCALFFMAEYHEGTTSQNPDLTR